jgi:hypothetical protein
MKTDPRSSNPSIFLFSFAQLLKSTPQIQSSHLIHLLHQFSIRISQSLFLLQSSISNSFSSFLFFSSKVIANPHSLLPGTEHALEQILRIVSLKVERNYGARQSIMEAVYSVIVLSLQRMRCFGVDKVILRDLEF